MQEVTSGDTAEVSKEIDATHTLPRNAVEVKGNENTQSLQFTEPVLNATFI